MNSSPSELNGENPGSLQSSPFMTRFKFFQIEMRIGLKTTLVA